MIKYIYNVLSDVAGEEYWHLLDYAVNAAPRFMFVVRRDGDINDFAHALISRLEGHIISIEKRNAWPGTSLIDREAMIYVFEVFDETSTILREFSRSLFSWRHPDLPEDLCFLRENGEPWLVTISHEQDGYFLFSYQEYYDLIGELPFLEKCIKLNE